MPSSKKLLVEGPGDQRVISALATKLGLPLKQGPEKFLVEIKAFSIPRLFDSAVLRAEAQDSGLQIMGMVLDADDNPERRLADLREACLEGIGVAIPESLPADGWIVEGEPGKLRFGVWMMPDNSSKGMLETFLAYLVPAEGDQVWTWTDELCGEARKKKAPFKEVHRDKARIHAYLAFQDEPGRQLHEAIINRILDPEHVMARKFFGWFCELFQENPGAPAPAEGREV